MTRQLQDALQDALDDLRELACRIARPCSRTGVAVALEAQVRNAAVVATVESHGVARYRDEIEAAVYFCARGPA